MDKIKNRFLKFILISGAGWIIDFSIYSILTMAAGFDVWISNIISSFAAITYVFFTSTKKTFVLRPDGLKKRQKYLLYLIYQVVLVTAVSFIADFIAQGLPDLALALSGNPQLTDSGASMPALYRLALDYGKLAAKVIITPVTMICNYFVLGWITEKL